MLVSSVFVLTALTMTGFYVKEKNEAEKDGYIVDMSTLEKKTEDKTKEIAQSVEEEAQADTAKGDDLDYDPNFQEASSGDVENTWSAEKEDESANRDIAREAMEDTELTDNVAAEDAMETASMEATRALSFHEKDNLGWPVAGNVLINYSMDKTVYFPTLQQYKYSPAIIIAASEGENITASADGKVLSVFEDAVFDIGNGYELTYGQLEDIIVLQGDVVSAGDVLGVVAAPTKYYSVEGPNVYFKLTKDGVPVNPLNSLE